MTRGGKESISHQTRSLENHRLKSATKVGDMLVSKRACERGFNFHFFEKM